MEMKSFDFWALFILASMPEKPLELEGMWRSCTGLNSGDLLYVAEFKKNELIEDYYGFQGGGGKCDGKRLFHYKRRWDLKYNNFNFITKYQESGYIYQPKEGAPNWYGCCHFRANDIERGKICRMHDMPGDHDLKLTNEFTYRIRGETMEINHKGNNSYLNRIEYPIWFKSKDQFWRFFYKTPAKMPTS